MLGFCLCQRWECLRLSPFWERGDRKGQASDEYADSSAQEVSVTKAGAPLTHVVICHITRERNRYLWLTVAQTLGIKSRTTWSAETSLQVCDISEEWSVQKVGGLLLMRDLMFPWLGSCVKMFDARLHRNYRLPYRNETDFDKRLRAPHRHVSGRFVGNYKALRDFQSSVPNLHNLEAPERDKSLHWR